MTTTAEKDVVIFRVDNEGTVYALFPYVEGSPGCCTAYHISTSGSIAALIISCVYRCPALPS